jgi:lysozyme
LILFQDTASARIAVGSLVQSDINDDRFGALVSFTFNVGKRNFQRSTLLKLVNYGVFDQVPQELLRWSSSKGTIVSGLLRRRACEGDLFMSRLRLGPLRRISMDSCTALGAASDITNPIDVGKGE